MQKADAVALARHAFPCFYCSQPIASASVSPNGTWLLPWRDGDTSGRTALAHQTAFRSALSGAGSRDRQAHPVNTPRFPQSRPTANLHPLGVSPTCSPPSQVQQLLRDGRRRIEVVLGNPWRWKWWLWEWLEQQPSSPKSDNAA